MIYQWIYTYSCWNRKKRPEDATSQGFATFSWTEGLPVEDIEELERRCAGYSIPLDPNIPSRPSQDEIDRLLPIAFYSFTLASGKKAIVRTKYIGEGFYDKRWGAIISHGFILENGDWPRYVMEYFDSPSFWNELPYSIREQAIQYKNDPNASQPPYLPSLDINDIVVTGKFCPETVAARISESKSYLNMLSAFLNVYKKNSAFEEVLCINASIDDIPWLFAGLLMAFPKEKSNDISFSTYLENRMPSENDVGRWYKIAGVERKNTYIDLETQPAEDNYKVFLDVFYTNRKEFNDFLQNFTFMEFDDITNAAIAFKIITSDFVVSSDDIKGTLNLLAEHGNEDVRMEFLNTLLSGKGVPCDISIEWLENVFSIASDCETLRPVFYNLFLENKDKIKDNQFAFFKKIAEKYQHEITDLWLDNYSSQDVSTNGLIFSFYSISKNGLADELNEKNWPFLFTAKASNADWNDIISKSSESFPDCLKSIIINCPDLAAQEQSLDKLILNENSAVELAKTALESGKDSVACAALKKYLVKEKKDHILVLKNLTKTFDRINRDFVSNVFWDLYASINENITSIEKDDLEWLLSHKKEVPENCFGIFLSDIDSNLFLPTKKDSEYFKLIESFLRIDGAESFYDKRSGLILWYLKVLEYEGEKKVYNSEFNRISKLGLAYKGLSEKEQWSLCDRTLPLLINFTEEKDIEKAINQQKDILMFFGETGYERIRNRFLDKYVALISSNTNIRKKIVLPSDVKFLACVKCAIGELDDQILRETILRVLAKRIFKKFKNKDMERVKNELGKLSGSEKKQWAELCNMVKMENTFYSKVKNVFNFIFRRN